MADEPENLILRYLRRIDEKVDNMGADIRDLKGRMSAVETGLNAVKRDLVTLTESDARLQITIDRQGERLDRIDRHLDLREA